MLNSSILNKDTTENKKKTLFESFYTLANSAYEEAGIVVFAGFGVYSAERNTKL